jgi:hypothetical protein
VKTTGLIQHRSGWGFGFITLPYGDVWRASRRMFTKYFNPSNPSINEPRDIIYVKRFLGQLLQKPDDFLQHVRTYVPIYHICSKHAFHFLRISLVGSTTLSMLYSIKVQPYNDLYIRVAEEAVAAAAELLITGAFLVDIIPVLKYVPEWFPGAKFQKKAATMREHAARIRNVPFAATEKLMVCDPLLFFIKLLENVLSRPAVNMNHPSSQMHWMRSNIPKPPTNTVIC